MGIEEAKTAIKALAELAEIKGDAANMLRGTRQQAAATGKLWRAGNKSKLIKIGMALIVFPEPTPISEIIGAGFLVAGAVQKGIQSQSIYMEDIGKTLKSTLKEIAEAKYNL
jgi:hypothetical protein